MVDIRGKCMRADVGERYARRAEHSILVVVGCFRGLF